MSEAIPIPCGCASLRPAPDGDGADNSELALTLWHSIECALIECVRCGATYDYDEMRAWWRGEA